MVVTTWEMQWVEAKDVGEVPTKHRIALSVKNYLVSSAEVQKPCFRPVTKIINAYCKILWEINKDSSNSTTQDNLFYFYFLFF